MKLIRKFTGLFGRQKLEAEMSEEMRLHLARRVEENIAAGASPEAARYEALRKFGGMEQAKEIAREQRGWMWLDHLARDLRQGWRMTRKTPLVSAVVVVSLGLGVGVNTVIFSWMQSVVLRPLPGVEGAAHLQLLEPKSETGSFPGASWPEYRELADRMKAFRDLIAYRMVPLNLGEPGSDERVYSQLVSGNYFSGLGLRPAVGRFFGTEETLAVGNAPVAVISHGLWQSRYGAAPDVIGKTLRLNDQLFTIAGVAPEGFLGTTVGLSFDLWVPATMGPVLLRNPSDLESRDTRGYAVLGRLRTTSTLAQARGEFEAVMRDLAAQFPATNASLGAELIPFWRAPRGAAQFLLPALGVMQGFMVLVLLVVCANAANLLLARSSTRRREIGVRLALGARPLQILRLVLVESALLGMLAAGLGAVVAWWGAEALRAVPLPGAFPFKFQTALDATGLIFAATLAFVCALLFGLAPALQSARTDSQLALRASSHVAGRRRIGGKLVAVEAGLALIVLIVAALFVRSFQERSEDTGYAKQAVLLAAYDMNGRGYDRAIGVAAIDELLRRLRETPGVESAAVASWVPLDFHGMPSGAFTIDGAARADGGQDRALSYNVTPDYFRTMEVPLVAGRDFSALTDADAEREAIVNEEFVRRFLPSGSPLGRTLVGRSRSKIVGVVRDALYETFGEPRKPVMYFSYRDRFSPSGQVHVHTRGSQTRLAPELQRIIREFNPAIAVYDVRSFSEHVDKNLFFRKIPARMFAVIGPLILLLAAIGIYAVVAYAVAQRTTEIGVRLALGASTRRVVGEIVRESMRGVLIGAGVAWFLAVVVMMHMRGGVLNASVLLGVPLLLAAVAALAAWLPARRAAKIDPMVALRSE